MQHRETKRKYEKRGKMSGLNGLRYIYLEFQKEIIESDKLIAEKFLLLMDTNT